MATVDLARIVEQLPTLKIEELRELNQMVQARLTPKVESLKREEFQRALFDAGLISKMRIPNQIAETRIEPIEVLGKPVSETIIEERR